MAISTEPADGRLGNIWRAFATALWMALSGTGPSEWLSALSFLALSLLGGYRSAETLLSTFRLTEDQLRQERPMQSDLEVRLGDIRRVFVGGVEVEIYVASGDAASPESAPVITFYRKLEGGDELIEKLARRLPPGAEVEHPSGELAGRLGGRT